MGRPKLVIDEKVLASLVICGGTDVELARHFLCSTKTLRRRWGRILKQHRASRRLKLRQLQWQQAAAGDVRMLIHLGRSELGQAYVPRDGEDDAVRRVVHVRGIASAVASSGPAPLPGQKLLPPPAAGGAGAGPDAAARRPE